MKVLYSTACLLAIVNAVKMRQEMEEVPMGDDMMDNLIGAIAGV